ncbi:MAG: hypothetical protein D3912_12630 [Candidatus Electrothrix sp. AX1]|nr:hypothetical protein [Candidatus Electrothrix sp. AX1]
MFGVVVHLLNNLSPVLQLLLCQIWYFGKTHHGFSYHNIAGSILSSLCWKRGKEEEEDGEAEEKEN